MVLKQCLQSMVPAGGCGCGCGVGFGTNGVEGWVVRFDWHLDFIRRPAENRVKMHCRVRVQRVQA